MGLLDEFLSQIDSAKRIGFANLGGLLSSPLETMRKLNAPDANTSGGLLQNNQYVPMLNPNAGEEGMAQAQKDQILGGLLGMTTFHGTPHTFAPTAKNPLGEFDLSKIGTGEGAQAYGHGIYVAQNPETAGIYANVLGQTEIKTPSGNVRLEMGAHTPEQNAAQWVAYQHQAGSKTPFDHAVLAAQSSQDNPAVIDILKQWRDSKASISNTGVKYHVDVPDEHIAKMLDWDAPIGKQVGIQSALDALGARNDLPSGFGAALNAAKSRQFDGQDLYMELSKIYDKATVSRVLHEAGIPGIKYLDAGSRSAADGTRNFVLFDPSIAKILKRE